MRKIGLLTVSLLVGISLFIGLDTRNIGAIDEPFGSYTFGVKDFLSEDTQHYIIDDNNNLFSWGSLNVSGRSLIGRNTNLSVPVKIIDKVKSVLIGRVASYAIKVDGSLWSWGFEYYGQLINGAISYQNTPIEILDNVKTVISIFPVTYAIKNDGTLWSWGQYDLLIGNGTTGPQNIPIKLMDNVEDLVVNEYTIYVIKSNGELWSWGRNTYGQVGNGTILDQNIPIKVLDNVKNLTLGNNTVYATMSNGELWSWGRNDYGQVGTGTTNDVTIPKKVLLNVKNVVSNNYSVYAIKDDNTLWSWGNNTYGQLGDANKYFNKYKPTIVMDNVRELSAKNSSVFAIKNDNTLWSWGYNNYGQLGSYIYNAIHTPYQILDNVLSVYNGDTSFALKNDGTLWSWGLNDFGQVGNGTYVNQTTPIKILNDISSFSPGSTLYAIKNDGSLLSWGYNNFGQVGNNTTNSQNVPVKVIENVEKIKLGDNWVISYGVDKLIWGWGYNLTGVFFNNIDSYISKPTRIILGSYMSITVDPYLKKPHFQIDKDYLIDDYSNLWLWGYNRFGQVGNGSTTDQYKPCVILSDVKSVIKSNYNMLAIKYDRSLWSWGSNSYGQVGNGTIIDQTLPTKILDDVIMAVGGSTSYAIKSDGSLWSWGYNSYGQVGNNSIANQTTPVKVLDNVNSISGGITTRAIKKDGSLWAWGANSVGQVGIGSNVNQTSPVKVLDNVISVSGGTTSFAIKNDNTLWTWGLNNYGQVGNGTITNQTTPVMVLDDVICVGGGYTVYAIKNNGSLMNWGLNNYGQVGNGSLIDQKTPMKVLDNVKSVSGNETIYAIRNDETLWVWGKDNYGQAGNGGLYTQTIPLKILEDVKSVIGGLASYAILNNGTLMSWGRNSDGQVGNGTTTNQETPIKILEDVISMEIGSASFAVTDDGTLWAWGDNRYGGVGNGVNNYLYPVKPCFTGYHIVNIEMNDSFNFDITTGGHYFLYSETLDNVGYKVVNQNIENNIQISSTNEVTSTNSGIATIEAFNKLSGIVYKTFDISINNDFTNIPIVYVVNNPSNIPSSQSHYIQIVNGNNTLLNGIPFVGGYIADEGEYTLKTANNIGVEYVSEKIIIDKTPPQITIDTFYSLPTNKSVTVSASVNEGSLNYDSYTFTSNGTFEFVATDLAGNISYKSVTITNIDKTPPIIYGVTNNQTYNSDRTITFDEGQALLNGLSIVSNTVVSSEGTYNLRLTDDAGNTTSVVFYIDKTGPTLSVTNFYEQPYLSAVRQLKINGKYYYYVRSTFTLSEEFDLYDTLIIPKNVTVSNRSYLNVRSLYVYGNFYNYSGVNIAYDLKCNNYNNIFYGSSSSYGVFLHSTYAYGYIGTIGVNGTKYMEIPLEITSYGSNLVSGKTIPGMTLTADGKYIVVDENGRFSFTYTDNASLSLVVKDVFNYSNTYNFTLDDLANLPEINIDGEGFIISFTEGSAKVNGVSVSSGYTIKNVGEYIVVLTDAYGNTTTKTIVIDNSKPVVTGVSNRVIYNSTRVITFNEGIAKMNGELFISGDSIASEGEYTLEVVNGMGYKTVVHFTIDKTAPIISGVESKNYLVTTPAITFNEGTAKLDGKVFNSGSKVTSTGSHTLVVTDLAGNSSTVSFVVITTLNTPILSVQSTKYNQLSLNWSSISGATSYEVYRSLSATGVFTLVKSTDGLTYVDSELAFNTMYYYKLKAIATVDSNSISSSFSDIVYSTTILPTINEITTKSKGYNGSLTSWSAIEGASGYELFFSTGTSTSFTLLKDVTLNSFSHIGLTTNIKYNYKVRAYRIVGKVKVYGGYSSVTSVIPIPEAPILTLSSTSYISLNVSWAAVAGATGYEVSYSTSESGTYTKLALVTSTSASVPSLTTNTTYYVKARAYRTVGTTKVYSDYSIIVSGVPIPSTPVLTVVPSGFDRLTFSWLAITGSTGYELYWLNPSTSIYELISDTTGLTYTQSDLISGVSQSYSLKAYRLVSGVKVYSNLSSIVSSTPIPSAITDFKTIKPSIDQLDLGWTSINGATGYEISQSSTATGTYNIIGTVESTNTYTRTGLTFSTTYYFKIRPYTTIEGVKVYGLWSSALIAKTMPSPVTGIVSKYTNYNTNLISWNSVSGATGYELYYSKGTSTTYTLVKAMTTTSYSHTGLTTNTKYNYKVRAYRLVGSTKIYGAFSNVVYSTPIPSVPSASVASSGHNSLKVTWAAVTGATGYEVSYSSSEAGVYTKLALVTTTSASIPSLNTNTTYYVKVRAYRIVGTTKVYSGYSNIVTGVPIPSTPTLSVVSVDFETLKISWTAVLGASGYELSVLNVAASSFSVILDTSSLSYTHTGLATGPSQTYRVRAYRLVGEIKIYGLYSTDVAVSPMLEAVLNFKVIKQSVDQIEFSWSPVKGAIGYEVQQYSSATGYYYSVGMIEGSNTYTVTGLTFNTSYTFRICAYTTLGTYKIYGPLSNVTTKTIPSPVVITVSSPSYTSIQVDWSAVSGATGYEIYRSTGTSTTYTLLKTQTTVGYLNTGLVFNTKYNYKVRAYKLSGTTKIYGAYSSIVSGIPVYSSPGSLNVVSSGYNSLYVNWAVVAGVSGYEVSYSTSEGGVYSILPLVTSTSTSISSLTTNTSYFIKVRTYRLVGTTKVYGGYSSIVSSKPIPNAPVLSVTSIDYDTLQITWPAVTGASGYELYHLNPSTSNYDLLSDATLLTYTENDLVTGVNTSYMIRAYRTIGDTKVYSLDSAIVSGKAVPATVADFILTMPGVSFLEFNWTDVAGAIGYEIYRSTSSAGTYVLAGSIEGTNTFINTGLLFNTTYYFKIRPYATIDSVKVYGGYSNAISGLTVPSTVELTATNLSFTTNSLSWIAISGADGYEIYFSSGSSTTYALLKTVTSVTYSHTGLVFNTKYNYKVRAYKLSGTTKIYGSYSSIESATVLVTLSQSNAVSKAATYLEYFAFSRDGLIAQLEYEGFSNEDAIYGVDNVGANWMQQAVLSAVNYLKYTAFSRDGLIAQLEYEKFSHEEAVYGADNAGANWQQQAVLSADNYLKYTAFSRVGLIAQLEYEKFSHEEAVYGVDNVGADWMKQAELMALNYLKYMAFTKAEMIAQLEYKGFTNEEAIQGAVSAGL